MNCVGKTSPAQLFLIWHKDHDDETCHEKTELIDDTDP